MANPLPLIPWPKTSILTCRLHLDSSRIAQHAALDLFVLGFAEQAYILLETIHGHGIDTKTKDYYGRTTSRQLTGAWGASDSFPSWANEVGGMDVDTISITGLPKHLATKAGEHRLSKEDVNFASKRLNANPDSTYPSLEKTMTLGAVAQVALLAGEEDLATSLIEKNMKELYQYLLDSWNDPDISGDETRKWLENRQGLQHCGGIWEKLLFSIMDDPGGLRVPLPNGPLADDYKDFLRVSNGIDEDLFSSTEDVTTDGRWMVDMEYTLYPGGGNDYLSYGADQDLDGIELGNYTCVTIGAGDHEGNVTLIPPTPVRPVIDRFEKAYAKASETNKKVYRRAALDIYGGIEELRALQWLCIEFQHSAYEQRIWGGLRPFLEDYAKRGVDEWMDVERWQRRDAKKKKKKREDG